MCVPANVRNPDKVDQLQQDTLVATHNPKDGVVYPDLAEYVTNRGLAEIFVAEANEADKRKYLRPVTAQHGWTVHRWVESVGGMVPSPPSGLCGR